VSLPRQYVAVCAADLAVTAIARGRWRRLRWVTKPLLMPVLGWWLHRHRRRSHDRLSRRTMAALGLSAAGDVALLREDDKGFVRGLMAFLGAHVAYVLAFGSSRRPFGATGTARRVAPVAVVWATVLPVLAARAGSLRVPVALYGTAIAVMQVMALMLDERLPPRARARIALGAAVFMLSDALIAARRFLLPGRYARTADVAVMGTYVIAQWLIADGTRRLARRG
jgi:uncharacterized membrane protein YhhN